MKLKRLVQKGYFPKELPPPFSTLHLANKLAAIRSKYASYSSAIPHESKPVILTIPKGKFSRRVLSIPHPKHFLDLCENIVAHWSSYTTAHAMSFYSYSKPTIRSQSRRAVETKSKSLNDFRLGLIKKAFDKTFELRFDIAQFYPSVYTHSITWAIMGVGDAKRYFKLKKKTAAWRALLVADPKAQLYEVGDKLDALVRNCQERQSIGIPIGPDTSFLIAEMIASRIDSEIRNSCGASVVCCRYYDDFYFYVNSRAEAERILKLSQKIVNDYKLSINESKISINEAPFKFEYEWANLLSAFRFKKIDEFEIRSFFDVVFRLIEKFPNESGQVAHYAMQRFEYGNVPIGRASWKTFLLLCLHLHVIESSNLDQFLRILLSYKIFVDRECKEAIRTSLETIIDKHLPLNHSFELSWSLWILLSLRIKLKSDQLDRVLATSDCFSKLICLDIIDRKLFIGKRPATSHIFRSLVHDDLYGDSWLYVYEAVFKKWLARANDSYLKADPFITTLYNSKVEFYLRDNQVGLEFRYDPTNKNPVVLTKPKKLTKDQKLHMLFAALGSSSY